MALISISLLVEAGAFTAGCALLDVRHIDPEKVSEFLTAIAAALVLVILIMLTPDPAKDAAGLYLSEAYLTEMNFSAGSDQ